ncbi:MAG: hypothetical protein CME06_04775 [Gemmatimonadetes bacterium]|nr:hypothetical protein [Gemmatimonadota bacterium]
MSPRLFLHVLSVETRKLMSYRVEFWLNTAVGFLAQFGAIYFLWKAMFAESEHSIIGGYSFDEMLLYYVSAILLTKLVRGRERESALSQEIYEGSYTRYIIYPTSFFRYKYAQHLGALAPASVQVMVFGAAAAVAIGPRTLETISMTSVAMTMVIVAIANLLHFVMKAPVEGVAFWADNVWSLDVMLRFIIGILGGAMLPLDLYPTWAQELLVWLPFQYITYFPVRVLVGEVGGIDFAIGVAIALFWTAVFAGVVRIVWKRGDLQYTGVGI